MGQAHSMTKFADSGTGTVALTCHLLGDPDLYGLGIRIAFYLQYLAISLALLTNSTKSLPALRAGLAVLTLALFVTLCTISTGSGLVLLDWYIAIALTAPCIFLTDLFPQAAALRAYIYRRHQGDTSVEDLVEANTRGPAGPRQRELIEATLSIYRSHHAVSDSLDHRVSADEELTTLRHALVDFGRAARDSPEVSERYSLDKIARATSSPQETYPLNEVKLESDLLRACVGTGMTHTEAAPTTRLVMNAAKRKYAATRARQVWLEVREGLHAARSRDIVFISVICISWAGFQLIRPWLYFEGLERGQKEGCDMQLIWFFVPTSAYGPKYKIWLKVWGSLMALIGVAAFSYGVFLLAKVVFVADKRGRDRVFLDVESQTSLLGGSDRSGNSPSLPECEMGHRKGRASRRCRIYFRCIGVLHFLVLGVMAGMVEVTIWVNDIDMATDDLGISSQMFALVVGVMASVSVYWEFLVHMPLKWVARRRSRDE